MRQRAELQLLNVIFLVIEDVLPEGVSFQDLHIGSEADDKTAGTFQGMNHSPEYLQDSRAVRARCQGASASKIGLPGYWKAEGVGILVTRTVGLSAK